METKEVLRMSFLQNETTKKFITGCFYIILGVLLCIFPQHVKIFVCYLFGGILILAGTLRVCGYYLSSGLKSFIFNGPTAGFVSIVFGLFFIVFNQEVIAIYPIVIVLFLIFKGVGKLIKGLAYRQAQMSTWWFDFTIGLILTVVGLILIIIDSTISGNIIIYLTGGSLIIQGIILIVTMIYLHHNMSELQKFFTKQKRVQNKKDDDDEVIDV